jgi:hypothetical protein
MRGIEHIPWLYDAMMSVMDVTGFSRWRRKLVGSVRTACWKWAAAPDATCPCMPPGPRSSRSTPISAHLRRAQRRAPRVLLVVARAEALPFAADHFRTVVSGLVFCSVQRPGCRPCRDPTRAGRGRAAAHDRTRAAHAPHPRADAGRYPARLDLGHRRVPPEPRHRGRGAARRLRDRSRGPCGQRRDAPVLGTHPATRRPGVLNSRQRRGRICRLTDRSASPDGPGSFPAGIGLHRDHLHHRAQAGVQVALVDFTLAFPTQFEVQALEFGLDGHAAPLRQRLGLGQAHARGIHRMHLEPALGEETALRPSPSARHSIRPGGSSPAATPARNSFGCVP